MGDAYSGGTTKFLWGQVLSLHTNYGLFQVHFSLSYPANLWLFLSGKAYGVPLTDD